MKTIISDFSKQAIYLPRALILLPVLIMAYLFLAENNHDQIKKKVIGAIRNGWLILFLFSLSFLMISTVLSRGYIKPIKDVFMNMTIFDRDGVNSDALENTLLLIPYSAFFMQTFKPNKPWKAVLFLSGITTCVIEGSQLIFSAGYFQLSDMLYNVLGGLIGCGLWLLIRYIYGKIKGKRVNSADR